MNPKAEGAFEAISYIREFMRKYKDRKNFASMLEDETVGLIDDIASGAAVDFRLRLTSLRG
jgi:hypothetical protein